VHGAIWITIYGWIAAKKNLVGVGLGWPSTVVRLEFFNRKHRWFPKNSNAVNVHRFLSFKGSMWARKIATAFSRISVRKAGGAEG